MAEESAPAQESSDSVDVEASTETVADMVRAEVEKEVAGLKATNQALKEEKKKLQAKSKLMDQFGDEEEINSLLAMKKRVDEDEESKLFLSGEREKYNDRITNRVREDADARLLALEENLKGIEQDRDKWADRYHSQQVSLSISNAAEEAGVNPRLRKAVEGQIKDQIFFDVGRDNVFVKDESDPATIRYGKEGKPMGVGELIEMLRNDQPELFLSSTGGGAAGGTGTSGLTGTISPDRVKGMSVAEYAKARKEGRI